MPRPKGGRPDTRVKRFWTHVHKTESCWLWNGIADRYALLDTIPVHRLSWMIHHGPIAPGLCICHRCDVPGCVNPGHLFLGTYAENTADMLSKLRHTHGEDTNTAKLTDAKIVEIFDLYDAGETQMQIAARVGVRQDQVSRILRRKSWRHVEISERLVASANRKLGKGQYFRARLLDCEDR